MKTAKIKSRKGSFLLEHTDARISQAHHKISGYRQKGVQTIITKTIQSEFDSNKVRRIIDEKCHFLNHAARMFVINQVLKKRSEIFSRLAIIDIPRNELKEIFEKITEFYSDTGKRQRLEELSRRKGRRDMLPGYNDRVILAECCWLRNKRKKEIILVTDDRDFTEFSEEIKNTFGIQVEALTS